MEEAISGGLPKPVLESPFYAGLARYFSEKELTKLTQATVGIAGAGGLGSNVALMLARSGIGNFTLVDCDQVDWSNLNRQQYWPCHVGMQKIAALSEILLTLNPLIHIDALDMKLDGRNVSYVLAKARIWVEALDGAEDKAMFVSQAQAHARFVAGACGICGVGGEPMTQKNLGKICLAGDFTSGLDSKNPYAPRVTQAAAMMADKILEYILNE